MIAQILKYHRLTFLFAGLSIAFYFAFAYQLDRSDFIKLITLYGGLFFLFLQILKIAKEHFWLLLGLAVLFRLIFLPVIPNLSQDFYRFIWDGRLAAQGINPYLTTVLQYLESGQANIVTQAQELYQGMGDLNASHYTNYPPVNQLCFVIAGFISKHSIIGAAIVFRVLIILADLGIIFFGRKLLKGLKLPEHYIFLYALNPFIIIEMTGNLHFEPVMIFFLIWSLYLLHLRKWIGSGVLLAISVSVKLIPLFFLPLFFQYFFLEKSNSWRRFRESLKSIPKLIGFYLVVLLSILVTFIPFLSPEFLANFTETIGLWFQKFEFNGSIYYIIRWIGFQTIGWNIIESVGKILPLITIGVLLLITFLRNNKTIGRTITAMVLSISFYFLLSTTVHPWYVAMPLALCVFTKYRFPLVWSATIMLSYSAYGLEGFKENLWMVALEYSIVIGYFIWEVSRKRSKIIIA